MPDLDPATLSRQDSFTTAAPSSFLLSSKANGITPITTSRAAKTVNPAQRIDIEPLYTNMKSMIGDNWLRYKEAVTLFLFGQSVL